MRPSHPRPFNTIAADSIATKITAVSGRARKVALIEPGIIDTAMATTNLPQYDANTIYPHGRRVHAFFTNPEKPAASPHLVGQMIRYVIEGIAHDAPTDSASSPAAASRRSKRR